MRTRLVCSRFVIGSLQWPFRRPRIIDTKDCGCKPIITGIVRCSRSKTAAYGTFMLLVTDSIPRQVLYGIIWLIQLPLAQVAFCPNCLASASPTYKRFERRIICRTVGEFTVGNSLSFAECAVKVQLKAGLETGPRVDEIVELCATPTNWQWELTSRSGNLRFDVQCADVESIAKAVQKMQKTRA
jgi:hypothetical protein